MPIHLPQTINFMKQFLTIPFVLMAVLSIAQTQTIRGTVADKDSKQPLADAVVKITTQGVTVTEVMSNEKGEYRLLNVPLGRHDIQISLNGHKTSFLNNIIVTSAKEVILNIELDDAQIELKSVKIKSKPKQGQPNNEMGLISVRQFSVDETDRFAGSRGDPSRMASNFAGVQGADDSRNDIVIRGNSPQGVLWRVEGVDIPNPNHFSIPGTTGGPVSIINNKILANSDFFTGAFPSEYGNSTAGVFDLKMRNGNNEKREYSSQLGFLGWDLMAEGPFSKKSKASYLATYRYSTLDLFSKLGIPIGTDAVPRYQDYSVRFNFPLKNQANLSFFAIGGASQIAIKISDEKQTSGNLYGDNDRDQYFKSSMNVFGANYMKQLNKKSYLKGSLAFTTQKMDVHHDLVFRHVDDTIVENNDTFYKYELDSLVDNLDYVFKQKSLGLHLFLNTKVNKVMTIKYGAQVTSYFLNYIDSARNFDSTNKQDYWKWFTRWNSKGTAMLLQPYITMKYKFGPKLTGTAGLHFQYFTVSDGNQAVSQFVGPEPRLGFRYQINSKQSLNLGIGMHSQIQPLYTYFYILPGNNKPHNLSMGMNRSNHYVLGYDLAFGKAMRFKAETYYQELYAIPVSNKSSSFSLLNSGAGFSRFFPDTLVNNGTGYNYGVELTLEKFFTKGYYYMTTLSLFEAKYSGSDGVLRNSDFNTNYAFNGLFAKEYKVGKKNTLNVGGKFTMAGARRYSPMDTIETLKQREYIELDASKNTLRFGSRYMRLDFRISYKINSKKLTHEFAIDLVNVTNRKNILKYSYISDAPYYRQTYQLGFLPLFYYKLDF